MTLAAEGEHLIYSCGRDSQTWAHSLLLIESIFLLELKISVVCKWFGLYILIPIDMCMYVHMQVCVSIVCARGQYQVSSLVTFYFLSDTGSLTESWAL